MKKELYLKLLECRKNNKMSQEDVAEQLHISRQTISQWERGVTEPDLNSLRKLCKVYGVSVSEMLDEEEQKPIAREEVAESGDCYEQQGFIRKHLISVIEILIITAAVWLAAQVAILGVVASIAVPIWFCFQKRSVGAKVVVILICCIGFMTSAQYTYNLICIWFFPNAGVGTVQPV